MNQKLDRLLDIIKELCSYACLSCPEKHAHLCKDCPVTKLKQEAYKICNIDTVLYPDSLIKEE